MHKGLWTIGVLAVALIACEDGPEQIFQPNEGDPVAQNGGKPGASFFQDGEKTFDSTAGSGDSVERARFCDEAENEAVVQKMVTQPIIPDVSAGGIALWSQDGTAVHANDLIGRPEDGKFCDPTVYSNALTWGPTNEVIAFINEETKLVESVVVTQQYLGTLQGSYTSSGTSIPVLIKLRDQVTVGTQKLTEYSSSADQASKPNSWLNHANLTKIYRMVRQTFFGASELSDSYNCVAAKLCDIIYTGSDESVPQDTVVVFQDSGVVMAFSPEGNVTDLLVEPVRVAPFEVSASLSFGSSPTQIAPQFVSQSEPTCTLDLTAGVTWGDFKQRCISSAKTLSRATYEVGTQRDTSEASFNGISFVFMRQIAKGEVFADGETPRDPDKLHEITFTRTLTAPVAEFVPAQLAATYKPLLEARIRSLAPSGHPFASYTLTVPAGLASTPQRIGELKDGSDQSWIPEVIADVQAQYEALTPAEKAAVSSRVIDPVFLIEPFVEAVLDAFSHGGSQAPFAFKTFRTTDDRRWSIGQLNFIQNGVPYRLIVQYSLNYGAVTAVTVNAGRSQIDEVFDSLNTRFRGSDPNPYYNLDLSSAPGNPLALGKNGIAVTGFDRKLQTLDVTLPLSVGNSWSNVSYTVPGSHVSDRSGFLKQLRGERYEFVPAHEVVLSGKETQMSFFVEANGLIGRIFQSRFKGALNLCPGLPIQYNDDLREKIDQYIASAGTAAFRDCEVVFNYSANGNVLDSVASLSNRISFTTVDGRAVSAAVWR